MKTRRLASLLTAAALVPCASAAAAPGDLTTPPSHCTGQTDAGGACTAGSPALDRMSDTVVSPDGRFVYAAVSAGIAHTARDPFTGALAPAGQTDVPERPAALAISPDGDTLYVAGATTGGLIRSTVRAFARDEQTGLLAEIDCYADAAGTSVQGCTTTQGLRQPTDLAVSADGRALYVAASTGGGSDGNPPGPDGAVSVLRTSAISGAFTELQCLPRTPTASGACAVPAVPELGHPSSVAVAPDGGHVYAVTTSGLVTLDRIASGADTGRLAGVTGCVGRPGSACALLPEFAPSPHTVRVAPDGSQAFVLIGGSVSSGVVVFDRDGASGDLTYRQCIDENSPGSCVPEPALFERHVRALAVSADGSTLYLGGGTGIVDQEGLLIAFRRDPVSGLFSRQSCAVGKGSACATATLGMVEDLRLAPDGRELLAAFTRVPNLMGHLAAFAVEQPSTPGPDPDPGPTPPATPTPTATPPATTPAPDRTAPVLRFAARLRKGRLTMTRTLDEAAVLHLQLERRTGGRWRPVGRPLVVGATSGTTRAVLRGRALARFGARRAGRFRIAASATDLVGNRALPRRARFRI